MTDKKKEILEKLKNDRKLIEKVLEKKGKKFESLPKPEKKI